MFGFGFWEIVLIALVALVVAGPKDLPKMLRKAGRMAAKLRRMAADLRAQSGIDDALRTEGLSDELAELRKLARGEIDRVDRAVRYEPPPDANPIVADDLRMRDYVIARDREYPRDGADSYGALPDDAVVYADTLPNSVWARDPLYALGDASAELPPEEAAEADDGASDAKAAGADDMPPGPVVGAHDDVADDGPPGPVVGAHDDVADVDPSERPTLDGKTDDIPTEASS